MSKDFFKHKAGSYEQTSHRVDNVNNIFKAIGNRIDFNKSMKIMDFGSGTGLLLQQVSPFVGAITAVDISTAMNEQLRNKIPDLACDVDIVEVDLATSTLNRTFDGVISSMTLHHVEHTQALFEKLHTLLNDNGFIAIADLDLEDGSFHTEDTGVYHCGFDRDTLAKQVSAAGFQRVTIDSASVVHKPQGDYPVFLLTAYR